MGRTRGGEIGVGLLYKGWGRGKNTRRINILSRKTVREIEASNPPLGAATRGKGA